jgi:hypothetical protein
MPEMRVLVSGNPFEPPGTKGDTAQWMARCCADNNINVRFSERAKHDRK